MAARHPACVTPHCLPRRDGQADVEAAKSRVRAAEAAREKERDSFAVVAGKEHRRRMSDALATAVAVADGVTAEVVADAERLEREREAMLVPQVSALVGGQVREMRGARYACVVTFLGWGASRASERSACFVPRFRASTAVRGSAGGGCLRVYGCGRGHAVRAREGSGRVAQKPLLLLCCVVVHNKKKQYPALSVVEL